MHGDEYVVFLNDKQQRALARLIDRVGYKYGNDAAYIKEIRDRLPVDPGPEDPVQD